MSSYVYGRNSFFEALKQGRILKAYVLNDKEIKGKIYLIRSVKEDILINWQLQAIIRVLSGKLRNISSAQLRK